MLSRYVAELAHSNGVTPELTHALAPPLTDDAFADSPAPRPPVDTVLFAGRVMPSKGARSLVHALARIPVSQRPLLHVAGEGPDLAATLEEARARGVDARALGRLDAATMRRAFDDATVVALPSLWGEPFGLVGIEALARGRPVAAYDVGAVSEWLPDGGGMLVPRGDERALGAAIVALLAEDSWERSSARAFGGRTDVYAAAARPTARGDLRRGGGVTQITLATGLAVRGIGDTRQVLLVASTYPNHPQPLWNLPGGRQQPGELLSETVAREALEETGLRVSVGGLAYLAESYDEGVHFLSAAFEVTIEATRSRVLRRPQRRPRRDRRLGTARRDRVADRGRRRARAAARVSKRRTRTTLRGLSQGRDNDQMADELDVARNDSQRSRWRE